MLFKVTSQCHGVAWFVFVVFFQKITNSTLLSVASTLKVQGPTYFPSAALIRPTQQSSLSIGVIGPLSNQQQARKVCLNPLLASYISSNGSASAAQTAKSLDPITLDSTTQMITAARPANVSPAMRSVPSMVLAARTLGHCRPIVTQASPQIFTRQAGVQLVTVAARTPNAPHTQGVMVVPGSVAVQVRLPGPSMSVAYHTSEGGASKLVPQQTGSSVCSVSMDLSKEKKLLLSVSGVNNIVPFSGIVWCRCCRSLCFYLSLLLWSLWMWASCLPELVL